MDNVIMNNMHLAHERGEFEVHYQSQVDPVTIGIVGLEALLRWRQPDGGLISADRNTQLAISRYLDDMNVRHANSGQRNV